MEAGEFTEKFRQVVSGKLVQVEDSAIPMLQEIFPENPYTAAGAVLSYGTELAAEQRGGPVVIDDKNVGEAIKKYQTI